MGLVIYLFIAALMTNGAAVLVDMTASQMIDIEIILPMIVSVMTLEELASRDGALVAVTT